MFYARYRRLLIISFTLIFALCSGFAHADQPSPEVFQVDGEDLLEWDEETVLIMESFDPMLDLQVSVLPAPEPLLDESRALVMMYQQFPYLRNYPRPAVELLTFDTPSGLLSTYNYMWDLLPNLVVEQDANNGEIVQYLDFALLDEIYTITPERALSQKAALMLAEARFESLRSAEVRDLHYPHPPEIQVEPEGFFVFVWTKHYFGIPYYNEQFIIVVHPVSGMPVLIVEQLDYSLVGDIMLPDEMLSMEDAVIELRRYLNPILVYVTLSEDQPQELIWFSGISISAFYADGSDLPYMMYETGVEPPDGVELLVSREEALLRFAA